MSVLIKICGLRDAATVEAAVAAGANAVGFVFAELGAWGAGSRLPEAGDGPPVVVLSIDTLRADHMWTMQSWRRLAQRSEPHRRRGPLLPGGR